MSHSTARKVHEYPEARSILSHEKSGRKKSYRIIDEESVIELLKATKKFIEDKSFEIRMPMNAIVDMTSLLLDESDDCRAEGYSRDHPHIRRMP